MSASDFQNRIDSLLWHLKTSRRKIGETDYNHSDYLTTLDGLAHPKSNLRTKLTAAARKFPTFTSFIEPKLLNISHKTFRKISAHNNFYLYFCNSTKIPACIYRQREVFTRFQAQHPNLETQITSYVTFHMEERDFQFIEPLLYQAYQIMASYEDLVGEDEDYLIR